MMSRNKKKIVAVIPARMGSSRFPGKPLENILGYPMIEHVRRRAERMSVIDEVYVATCDEEIKAAVEQNGGKVIMTADTHERCTDRIEEAAHQFEADVVVNIQGDEPTVSERAIEEVVQPFLQDHYVKTTCLVYPIEDLAELESPNIVKCVLSRTEKILYLSRSVIPGRSIEKNHKYFKQSGIMAFTKDFLHQFNRLEPGTLEAKESVDMLRVLEHDLSIQGVVSLHESMGVDIPEHIRIIEKRIKSSPEEYQMFRSIFEVEL